jgi:hypothetical protein
MSYTYKSNPKTTTTNPKLQKTIRRNHKDYSIIFFDDMKYNIDDMNNAFKTHITCVYLPHQKSNLLQENPHDESITEDSNSYIEKVKTVDPHLYKKTTKSFELSIHKPLLLDWANKHKSNAKIVIFDWDHALSVTNGVFPPNTFNEMNRLNTATAFRRSRKISYQNANIHLYDVAVFLMGGQTRLSGLIDMFQLLRKQGCHIFILTANSIAIDHRKEFIKVIQQIIPQFQEKYLICSNIGGVNRDYTVPKSRALLHNSVFRKLSHI